MARSYDDVIVVYDDKSERIVKRFSDENIDAFKDCTEKIITEFYANDFALRDILQDPEVELAFEQLCSIIPVVRKGFKSSAGEVEYLDWEKIKHDYEQLIVLFCNASLKADRTFTGYDPGLVIKLNFIQTSLWMKKGLQKAEEALKEMFPTTESKQT